KTRRLGVVRKNRAIDGAEEPFRVDVCLVCLPAVAVMHSVACSADASVGSDGLVRFSQLLAQRVCDCPRHAHNQLELIKRVSVAFEQANLVQAKSKDLVAIDRLKEAPQWLCMETVGDHNQFGNRLRKPQRQKDTRPAQYRQAIESVIPELGIVCEGFEGFQQLLRLDGRILLAQRRFQLLHEVPKPNRVLLVLRMPPMSRLVQRETRRFFVGRQSVKYLVRKSDRRKCFGHDSLHYMCAKTRRSRFLCFSTASNNKRRHSYIDYVSPLRYAVNNIGNQ